MTQDNLINVITVILLSGFFIYFMAALSKKWLPATTIKPFKSFSEIKQYYLSSISIIRGKLWLLILPLSFALLQPMLLGFLTFKFFQTDISNLTENSMDVLKVLLGQPFLSGLIKSFLHTPAMLAYGFNHAISQSTIFMAFFLICTLTYGGEIKRLTKNSTDANLVNIYFIKKVFIASLFSLVTMGLFAGVLYFIEPLGIFRIFCFLVIFVSVFIWGLLCLAAFTLLQAFILFSVKDAIQDNNLKFKEILNKSLAIIKPLFVVNAVIYTIGSLSSVMMIPTTMTQFFDLTNIMPFNLIIFFQNVSVIYSYLFSFLIVFFFCVPLILVNFNKSAYEAFKITINFIRNFLSKYLIFVGIGIVFLFIPSFIESFLSLFVYPYSIQSFFIELFTITLRVTLAVIFYIAMFKFIHETSKIGVIEKRT